MRGSERGRFSEIFERFLRGFERVFRGFERFSEVLRGFQRFLRGFQRSSQRPSQRQISSQRLSVLLPLIVLPLELSPRGSTKNLPPPRSSATAQHQHFKAFFDKRVLKMHRHVVIHKLNAPQSQIAISQGNSAADFRSEAAESNRGCQRWKFAPMKRNVSLFYSVSDIPAISLLRWKLAITIAIAKIAGSRRTQFRNPFDTLLFLNKRFDMRMSF